MTGFRTVAVFFCSLVLLVQTAAAATDGIQWQALEPGLELVRVNVAFVPSASSVENQPTSQSNQPVSRESVSVSATLLRIDPARFTFSLYMASERGAKTLGGVAAGENFVAAINAGMFQRDGLTSTGYLRGETHTNNNHIAANFGAFFVALPDNPAFPQARVMDKYEDDWEALIKRYALVMQNYRMTTVGGRVIWKQAARIHSVAALSQDAEGRILFILCSSPVPAADFMTALLRLPLALKTVMYLEGGSEAALLINAGGINIVEAGRHTSGLWGGSASLMLPNVLGVRRRAESASGGVGQ